MADKKITELTQLNSAASGDLFPIVDIDQNETKKITKAAIMGYPGPIGTWSPSSGIFTTGEFSTLQVASGIVVNDFSDDDSLSGNSHTALVTEYAVKTYVDSKIGNSIDQNINDLSYSGTTIENVTIDSTSTTVGTLVYRNTSGVYVESIGTDETSVATAVVVGPTTVMIEGFVRNDSLFSFDSADIGQKVFLSANISGASTSTKPSTLGDRVQIVGEIWDTSTILFNPNSVTVEIF